MLLVLHGLAGTAHANQTQTASGSVATTVLSTESKVTVELTLPGLKPTVVGDQTVWSLPEEGKLSIPGQPDLPSIGRFVRVPDRGRIELDYSGNTHTVEAPAPAIYTEDSEKGDNPTAVASSQNDSELIVVSAPIIMRGVRMVHVTINPVLWNAVSNNYRVTDRIKFTLTATNRPGVNEVTRPAPSASHGFNTLMDGLLLNPPTRDDDKAELLPGGYCVVMNDPPPAGADEFIDAKKLAGHPVEVVLFNPDEVDQNNLREMIRDVYQVTGFEFLILMGNEEADAPLHIPYDQQMYDMYYGQLDGEDIFADVAVGTMNCQTEENFHCAVRRAVRYQYDPSIENKAWFSSAAVGVGHCSVGDTDWSPSYTGMWVANTLAQVGFDDIATHYWSETLNDNFSPMIYDRYREGVNFVLVRGHQSDFNPDGIEPGPGNPFHFLTSSATIRENNGGAFNQLFRSGNLEDLRGPSAGFGHYSSPRTNIANALAGGLIESMFLLDIGSYGWARNYTVAKLTTVMPDDGEFNMLQYYYSHWRYYGDPGQFCWVGVPNDVEITCPDRIYPGSTDFPVTITTGDNQPVENAVVALSNPTLGVLTAITDANGKAYFTFHPANALNSSIELMVTAKGYLPYWREVQLAGVNQPYLAMTTHSFVDMQGNPVVLFTPGLEFKASVTIKNFSAQPTGVVTISQPKVQSPWCTARLTQAQGELQWPPFFGQMSQPFANLITGKILPGAPDGEIVRMTLPINAGVGANYTIGLDFIITGATIELVSAVAEIGPGQAAELTVTLQNTGTRASQQLASRLEAVSPFIEVLGEDADYDAMNPGGEREATFQIRADVRTVAGSLANFHLIYLVEEGIEDTIAFSILIGEAAVTDALGPDGYGYIAIDNEDNPTAWGDAPDYDWLDISPWGGDLPGEQLPLPGQGELDSSVVVDMPFNFRYYGQDFDKITVCNNGWIAVGDQGTLKNQQNWPLPGYDGAFGMIAPFWDRLDMQTRADGVFHYYSAIQGIYVIEWHTGVANFGDWLPNVFELVIYNPIMHPTPTGDAKILFQYKTVNNVQEQWEANHGCTVGLSSPNGLDGISYTYWKNYPDAAAPLIDGRAILWMPTTYKQGGVISGTVTRKMDGEPVAGVTVTATGDKVVHSGADGYFQFWGLEEGAYDLQFTKDGYEEQAVLDLNLEVEGRIVQDVVLSNSWITTVEDTIRFDFAGFDTVVVVELTNEGDITGTVEDVYAIFTGDSLPEGVTLTYDSLALDIEAEDQKDIPLKLALIPDQPLLAGMYTGELLVISNSPIDTLRVPLVLTVNEDVSVRINTRQLPPTVYELGNAYPNPFNGRTVVSVAIPQSGEISLGLYDVNGRLVQMVANRHLNAGRYDIAFNADTLPAGLYLLRMEADGFSAVRRLVLVR